MLAGQLGRLAEGRGEASRREPHGEDSWVYVGSADCSLYRGLIGGLLPLLWLSCPWEVGGILGLHYCRLGLSSGSSTSVPLPVSSRQRLQHAGCARKTPLPVPCIRGLPPQEPREGGQPIGCSQRCQWRPRWTCQCWLRLLPPGPEPSWENSVCAWQLGRCSSD